MNLQTNSAAPSGVAPLAMPISAISSRLLAHRVGVAHSSVCICIDSAAERLGRPDLVQPRHGRDSGNRPQAHSMVGVEIITEMARAAALSGNHATAQTYRDMIAEATAGEVHGPDRVALPSGVLAPPTNPRNAERREEKRARRAALVGVLPTFETRDGRLGMDHRAVGNFIGSQTARVLQSCAKLIAGHPELLGVTIFGTLISYKAGRLNAAEHNSPGFFLTAEAVDALADQFGLCTNERGRAKTVLLRDLAGHLRAASDDNLGKAVAE